jgi:hypothetical protein
VSQEEDDEMVRNMRTHHEKIEQDKEVLDGFGQQKIKASSDYEHYHSRLEKYRAEIEAAQAKV